MGTPLCMKERTNEWAGGWMSISNNKTKKKRIIVEWGGGGRNEWAWQRRDVRKRDAMQQKCVSGMRHDLQDEHNGLISLACLSLKAFGFTLQHARDKGQHYPTLCDIFQHWPTLANIISHHLKKMETFSQRCNVAFQHSKTFPNIIQHYPTLSNITQHFKLICDVPKHFFYV